jgi:glutamyl-tRNA synthetase
MQNSKAYKLKNAEQNNVVTRFPPEASGFLHIGHAKAAIINSMVRKEYNGKMLLRFDDTNPNKENPEYEDAILYDLKLLKIDYIGPSYTSDYFDIMMDMALQLINKGLAYCDCTEQSIMNDERMKKLESKYRNTSVDENIKIWNEMKLGTDTGIKYCLRAKIDPKHNNGAMRDPTLYRCNLNPHPRTHDKYKVYPTYDFACPIVDSLENVTHALRTSEYHDRNEQYFWLCDSLGLRKPFIEDYSRLNMEYCLMSKRKLTLLVDKKYVDGWDDPRLPTLRGLIRHGIHVDAIYEFMIIQGMSKSINRMQWNKLWSINYKIIDNLSPRFSAVNNKLKVRCTLFGKDVPNTLLPTEKLLSKKNTNLGIKTSYFSNVIYLEEKDIEFLNVGDEITLMDWGNANVKSINTYEDHITSCDLELNLSGDYKTTTYKLNWIPENDKSVLLKVKEYNNLLTEKDPDGDFDNIINKNSLLEMTLLGEEAIKIVKKGDTIQLERRGFYIVDSISPEIILINIPDGKDKVNHLSEKALLKK